MLEAFDVALNVIAPIMLVIGISALISRRFNLNAETLSTLILYLFIPALVIDGLSQLEVSGEEILSLAMMVMIFSTIMVAIGWSVSRTIGINRHTESAFIISVMLTNTANYGIPFNVFAFGEEARQFAILFYVGSTVVTNTFGIYFASRGSASIRESAINIFKIPLSYATFFGLFLNGTNSTLPLPIERMIELLADAAIPGMLVLLGIQLSRLKIDKNYGPVLAASTTRLLIGPLVAFPITLLLGMEGLIQKVSIVQAAMPTAVITAVLAAQFNSDVGFTTTVILVTTLASILTLSILITIL
jgi:hypothetical protein